VEKQRLLDLYQAGDIALEEIKERLKSIRTRIKKIEGERALLEQEDKTQQHSLQLIEQFESFKKRITKNLATLNFAEKKEVVRLLVKDVIVDTTTEEMVINHIVPIEKSSPLCPGRVGRALPQQLVGVP
jgi:DNA integrity scanning protein DisA with diadenylate cyclase activity